MTSGNAATRNRRAGHCALLTSLCIHVAAFIYLGMIVLNVEPKSLESMNVELVKATQQIRKLHRDIPRSRSRIVNDAEPPTKAQNAIRQLINQVTVSSYAAEEVIPVFQYEAVKTLSPRTHLQTASVNRPLAAPKITAAKPVARKTSEDVFNISARLPELPASHNLATPSIRKVSDPKILQDFLQTISGKIEKSKRYPEWAADTGLEGKAVVRFTILQNGTLGENILLVSSSGAKILDDAAIAAVKDAAPFPALPRALRREWLQIELPMDFRLEES